MPFYAHSFTCAECGKSFNSSQAYNEGFSKHPHYRASGETTGKAPERASSPTLVTNMPTRPEPNAGSNNTSNAHDEPNEPNTDNVVKDQHKSTINYMLQFLMTFQKVILYILCVEIKTLQVSQT